MTEVVVYLQTIDIAKEFADTANKIDAEMELTNERYVVDAKSILGIFSLDLRYPLRLIIHSDDSSIAQAFAKYIAY